MPGSPEQAQQRMQRWMEWLKELSEKGHVKDAGHPLERAGKIVKGTARPSPTGRSPKPRTSSAATRSCRRGSRARRRAVDGLSDLRSRRLRRSASGHEDGHSRWSSTTICSGANRAAWSPR